MAALDEFVTRARSQNDNHHAARVVSLGHLATSAQDGLSLATKDSDERKAVFTEFGANHATQMAEIDQLVNTLQNETREPLQRLQTDVSEYTMVDYIPTGQTPQKRDWTYPTQLLRTENHESLIARRRGLPDPSLATTKTPGKSPRKQQASPRKGFSSPSKAPSPSKTKVFTDVMKPDKSHFSKSVQDHGHTISIPIDQTKSGLKEVNINVVPRPTSSSASTMADERPVLIDFSKSIGSGSVGANGPPPLKRHATTNAVVESKLAMKLPRAKSSIAVMAAGSGVENFSQSVGPPPVLSSGRRLRSSPPE